MNYSIKCPECEGDGGYTLEYFYASPTHCVCKRCDGSGEIEGSVTEQEFNQLVDLLANGEMSEACELLNL